MSDYCEGCRFDPKAATGDRACPFTTLYLHFLARNQRRMWDNRQMMFQLKNLARRAMASAAPSSHASRS